MVIGINSLSRMPVDLFPAINIPEVVVATFYSGMPPEDIEVDITNPLERFFTLASGVDHMESRSLLGVSIIKVYLPAGNQRRRRCHPALQPGAGRSEAPAAGNAAAGGAEIRRLQPSGLPGHGQGTRASTKRSFTMRRSSPSATRSRWSKARRFRPPFGGKYRQAMVYVDPYKLLSRQLSVMDVVNAVNNSNVILPAGDVKIGPNDYYVYSNSLVKKVEDLNNLPIKTVGTRWVTVSRHRRGQGRRSIAIQHRPRGRPEVRLHPDHEAGRRHQHHRGGQRRP